MDRWVRKGGGNPGGQCHIGSLGKSKERKYRQVGTKENEWQLVIDWMWQPWVWETVGLGKAWDGSQVWTGGLDGCRYKHMFLEGTKSDQRRVFNSYREHIICQALGIMYAISLNSLW